MDDKADQPKRRWPTYLAIALVLLLVLYPLSVGPATVLAFRWQDDTFFELYALFYKPLIVVIDFTGMEESISLYIRSWFRITNTTIPIVETIGIDGNLVTEPAF